MKTVLLLDDDEDLRAILETSLLAQGLRVLQAGKGQDAEEILKTENVDLVVVDGLLPDTAGVDFIARLRTWREDIHVVFVSAFFRDLKTFKRLSVDLDVELVLHKPIDLDAFAERVTGLLRQKERPAETSTPTPDPALAPVSAPAPAPAPAPFAVELAELRRTFGAKLPIKLGDLETTIRAARNDPREMDEARMRAHRLRGSAGSYGYAAVGEEVAVVEDLLCEGQTHGTSRRFYWEEIFAALQNAVLAAKRDPIFFDDASGPMGDVNRVLLVVDDDPDFLAMVRTLSRRLLVDVVTAESMEEAIARAAVQPLVAAIIDVHLNGELSFSAATKIRETAGNNEIPLAFTSVDGRMETRVAAIEAGGSRFFDKPISEEGFTDLLQQFLTLSRDRQPRLLIVDDDIDIVTQYTHILRHAGYVVDALRTPDALLERLEELSPDVLLLDINLPRVSGIDICRALRGSDRWALLPILIVSAHLDAKTRLQSFRAGASDVVGKPIVAEELLARVGVQEERMRLLRDRADKDPLSGLMLRRPFVEAFQRSLSACGRDNKPLSLVVFDLDRFKQINDTYGHLAGDRVIAAFGNLLRRRFRIEDLRGRWGGEEFVLAFPGQGLDFAAQSARRILAEFSALTFEADGGDTFHVTFTAGAAAYPDDGTSITALVRRADELLYVGKQRGRNMVLGDGSPKQQGCTPSQQECQS